MRKGLLAFALLFILFPIKNALAFGDGLLGEKSGYTVTSNSGAKNPENAYDGDPSTFATLSPGANNATIEFKFDSPKIIRQFKVISSSEYNRPTIRFYDSANKLIHSYGHDAANNGDLMTLGLDDVQRVQIRTITSIINFYEIELYDTKEYASIKDLVANKTHNQVDLSWTNPEDDEFNAILIKRDGKIIKELGAAVQSFKDTNVTAETTYKYDVIAKYKDGAEAYPVSITVKTDDVPEVVLEVEKLTAKATHDRVDLKWTLPESDKLQHVIIYRETMQKSFLNKLLGVATVQAAATPIFETNGTYFNDLTVSPETKYEYTVTTLSTDDVESEGVSVTVTTPAAPLPEIGGGGHDVDPETGDYTYYWSEPTTGKVKVIVGGKEYATVPAADGKIVIPAADMKYTILGNPDVRLIPIDEDGREGKPVNPPPTGGIGGGGGGGNIGFNGLDLMQTIFQLIAMLSGYILLWLAIEWVPKIVAVIKSSANKGRATKQ